MNCKIIQDLILTDYMDDELNASQKEDVKKHLASCAACREYEAVLKEKVVGSLRNAQHPKPPESVWQNIRAAVSEQPQEEFAFGFLERLRNLLPVSKPAFVLATIVVIMLIAVTFTKLPYFNQPTTKELANAYLNEISDYLVYGNGEDILSEEMEVLSEMEKYLM